MIENMRGTSSWTHNVFDHSNTEQARLRNEDIAHNLIYKALLARWVMFDTFIKVVKELNGGVVYNDA